MLIKEYHILLPMSLDEYQVAQLYMIQVRTEGRAVLELLHGGVKQEYAGRRGIVLLDPPPTHTHTSSVSGFCRPEEENRHPLDIKAEGRDRGAEGQERPTGAFHPLNAQPAQPA